MIKKINKKNYYQTILTVISSSSLLLNGISHVIAAEHEVVAGDSLYTIGLNYGVSVEELIQWNQLSNDLIFPGDTLIVEGPTLHTETVSPVEGTYTVMPGDSLYIIAQSNGITVDQLMAWNGLASNLIFPGDILKVVQNETVEVSSNNQTSQPVTNHSSSTSGVHVVNAGESVDIIANIYGITVEELKAWNGLTSDLIHPGNELKVSGSAISSAETTDIATATSQSVSETSVSQGIDNQTTLDAASDVDSEKLLTTDDTEVIVPEGDLTAYISQAKTSYKTSQIVGLVGQGTNAKLFLFERDAQGNWNQIKEMNGRIGNQGLGKGQTGSKVTPLGAFVLTDAFGAADTYPTKLDYHQITHQSYWITNLSDAQFDSWQERESSAEGDIHFASQPDIYQLGIVLNDKVGQQAGYFIHLDNGHATTGGIAVSEEDLSFLMEHIEPGAYIINAATVEEWANY